MDIRLSSGSSAENARYIIPSSNKVKTDHAQLRSAASVAIKEPKLISTDKRVESTLQNRIKSHTRNENTPPIQLVKLDLFPSSGKLYDTFSKSSSLLSARRKLLFNATTSHPTSNPSSGLRPALISKSSPMAAMPLATVSSEAFRVRWDKLTRESFRNRTDASVATALQCHHSATKTPRKILVTPKRAESWRS